MALEQVTRGYRRPGLEADLPAAVAGAHPGLVDGDHPPAEGRLGGLAAVAARPPGRVVLALLAGNLGDLSRQQLAEDVEADVDGRREQAVAHVVGEDLQLAFDLVGERLGQLGALEVDQPEAGHQAQVRARGFLRV